MMETLTQQEALNLFEYRDGALYWRDKFDSRNRPSPKNGRKAGHISGNGYIKVGLKKREFYVHRIVFLMFNGFLPEIVDHIDGDTTNNRIENLRASSKPFNAYNSKTRADNSSGHKGVVWHKAANKWAARIAVKMKSKHLGLFDDFEFACFVSDEARRFYHGNHARI